MTKKAYKPYYSNWLSKSVESQTQYETIAGKPWQVLYSFSNGYKASVLNCGKDEFEIALRNVSGNIVIDTPVIKNGLTFANKKDVENILIKICNLPKIGTKNSDLAKSLRTQLEDLSAKLSDCVNYPGEAPCKLDDWSIALEGIAQYIHYFEEVFQNQEK